MIRNLTTTLIFTLMTFAALGVTASEPTVIDTDVFPVGQPILMATEDGDRLIAVTGRLRNLRWGFSLHVSADGGSTWDKTYDEVWSEGFTEVDAVSYGDSVYVAQIDSWASGSSEYWDLNVQRFDSSGVRDTTFGGSGRVSINHPAAEVSDVSLVAQNGYLEVFWIADSTLHHSYLSISGGSGPVTHSDIGTVIAYGSLDAVAMTGQNFHFFAAFRGASNQLTGWRWTFGVGSGTVDITPETNLYPETEDVSVSSFGSRVQVVVGSPFDSNPTEVHSMWSDDDALSWNQEVLATGWDGVGIHVWSPSAVMGSGQTVATVMIKDDNAGLAEWAHLERAHGGSWTPSPQIFSPDTDFIGTPMGLCWAPEGGFMAVYYSNQPESSAVYFVKLPQVMRTGFEDGDLDAWSVVVGQ